jgi:branched-chain amino acid transport system permease protein
VSVLQAILVDPFVMIWEVPLFFVEVLIGGLMAGVMYSLVALGFVLIFKASGVFNFAQGAMVLFAALCFAGLIDDVGLNPWLAFAITVLIMVALAFAIERIVLRQLVNQAPIILFMATIGITFFLDGFGQTIWGSEVRTLDLGIPQDPWIVGGIYINKFDLFAAVTCGALVASLALFFQFTPTGRALRAVADDHQAALSVGIPLKVIWTIVWSVSRLSRIMVVFQWLAKVDQLGLVSEITGGRR